MISEKEAEDAAHALIDTARDLAGLEGRLRSLERSEQIALDFAFIMAEGKNIEEKKANARVSPKYSAAFDEVTPVMVEMKTLYYKRKGWDDLVALYRTQESSRRAGV